MLPFRAGKEVVSLMYEEGTCPSVLSVRCTFYPLVCLRVLENTTVSSELIKECKKKVTTKKMNENVVNVIESYPFFYCPFHHPTIHVYSVILIA